MRNFIKNYDTEYCMGEVSTILILVGSSTNWLSIQLTTILGYSLQTNTPTGDVGGFPDRFYIFTTANVLLICIVIALIVFYMFRNYGRDEK
jgi:hypothetical protein